MRLEPVLAFAMRRRFSLAWLIGLVIVTSLVLITRPQAQTAPDASPWGSSDATPSFKILTGTPVSLSAASTYYGSSTTSTNGLCRDFSSNANVCPSGVRPREPEIKELARALRNDPDLIYEYVRNAVDTEFTFGTHKGPLGVIIDKSGGAFDQAELMVELLREAGFTASYRYGSITLTPSQWQDWSGLQAAKASCELLAAGGIPASVNSSSSACSGLSGNVTTITLAHVWVQAVIGGTTYQFDPAYKPYLTKAPLSTLRTDMGLTTGAAYTAATTGMTTANSGKTITGLSKSGLATVLQTYTDNLRGRFDDSDLQGAGLDDVVGGREIVPATRPTGGWRQTSLSYVDSGAVTWTGGVPDQFRATVKVSWISTSSVTTDIATFFADEIYGRKLEIVADHLDFDGISVATHAAPNIVKIKVAVNHPFAASTGAYADADCIANMDITDAVPIIVGWGAISPALGSKWAQEQAMGRVGDYYSTTKQQGDLQRSRLAAAWLAQFTQATKINDGLAGARTTHLHTIGFVIPTYGVSQWSEPSTDFRLDFVDTLDFETAAALTNVSGDAASRRSGALALAAVAATLEGSVAEQLNDTPDSASTARRFDYGNAPVDYSDTGTATSGSAISFYRVFQGDTTPAGTAFAQNANEAFYFDRRTGLVSAINAYKAKGFNITVSGSVYLGPGLHGAEIPPGAEGPIVAVATQRGGAFVATKYDESGEPIEVAHVLVGYYNNSKGGGGSTPAYNPKDSADLLKDKFVDRSTMLGVSLNSGTAGYNSPVVKSVGQGEFPYRLDETLSLRGFGLTGRAHYSVTSSSDRATLRIGEGLVSNFDGSADLSSSGMEAMGVSRIDAAAPSIAAFAALQDIYKATAAPQRDVAALLTADWWGRRLVGNVVTVMQGGSSEQFIEAGMDGTARLFIPSSGGPSSVTLSGAREPMVLYTFDGVYHTSSGQRSYIARNLVFGHRDGHGNTKSYSYWTNLTFTSGLWHSPNGGMPISGFRLNQWGFARGVTLTFSYPTAHPGIPSSVSSNAGPSLTLSGAPLTSFEALTNVTVSQPDPACQSWASTVSNGTSGERSISFADAAGSTFEIDLAAPQARSLSERPMDACHLQAVTSPGNATMAYGFDTLGRIKQGTDANGNVHLFFIAEGYRGEWEDPLGGRYAVETLQSGSKMRNIDELGRVVTTTKDGRGRVTERLYPEGNKAQFTYDARDNAVELRQVAKPGSGLSDIVVSATWSSTWNFATSVTDARGYTTDLAYNAQGLPSTIQRPAPSGSGARPTYTYTYNSLGQPLSTTDPTGVVTQNTFGTDHFLATTTLDPTGVNSVSTFTADTAGNVTAVNGPRSDVTDIMNMTFDSQRRKVFEIGPDPDGAGALLRPATKYTYDLMGRVTKVERGTTTSSTGSDFSVLTTTTYVYDLMGNKVKEISPSGVTQLFYDGRNLLTCTAVRMNPAVYGSLPSTCVLSTTGSFGPDQLTRTVYDAAGQVLKVQKAYGTSIQQDSATYTYTTNGLQASVTDSNGNLSAYEYDGLDGLAKLRFPSTTLGSGTASTTDFEAYTYDAAGNRISLRKRDGSVIAYSYDRLNRETVKDIPGGTAADVYSEYDFAGRPRHISFAAATGAGDPASITSCTTPGTGIDYCYDSAGQMVSETTFGRTMASQYDVAGNRTRVTWPDSFYIGYGYDALNRMKSANENGATSGVGLSLAAFGYDNLGRRASLTRGNGASTAYSYDDASRMTALAHDALSTANDQTYGFTYSPANQIRTRTTSNALFDWIDHPTATVNRAFDGLNRDAAIAAISGGYDANGNVANDGVRTNTYDVENRLVSVSGTPGLTLSYDPIGRLRQTVSAGATTQFLYDGDRLVAEYDGAGTLVHRYAHGPNTDEALVWYVGSGTTARHFLHADWQGSIVGESDSTGAITQIYSYGPWGENGAGWTGSRFRYTGQLMLPEAGVYFYKARVYDPISGRFLQTDPVGYKDDLNLYTYVHGDPVNATDPSGTATCGKTLSEGQCVETLLAQTKALNEVRDTRAAIGELRAERAEIKAGTRSELSAGAAAFEGSFKSHFGSSSNATLGRVDRALAGTERVLADDTGKWKYQFGVRSEGFMGTQTPFSRNIKLNSVFFDRNIGQQITTLVHEATHPFLARVPELYSDSYMYGAAGLWPWWAQNNAENYSHFVTGKH